MAGTTSVSVTAMDVRTIPDIGSGINQLLEAVRNLQWEADGTDEGPGRSRTQWGDEGVCGFASAYLGPWKITVALAHRVGRERFSCQRVERWQDGLVSVEPCPRVEAGLDQEVWAQLPVGELDDDAWAATRALNGLHDLRAVIEEVVRYLLDLHLLPGVWDAAREAVIQALREDLARWAREDATEAELCGIVWRAKWGED